MYRNRGGATLGMARTAEQSGDLPVDAILARVADHMTQLADKLASTETAVAEHFKEVLASDVGAFQDVQNLDYLQQSMTDTAKLLAALGSGCRMQIELINALQLETTRALVTNETRADTACENGTIDFF